MTLDYTKMFLIVTEEAVVKGRFAFIDNEFSPPFGAFFLPVLMCVASNFNLSEHRNALRQLPEGISVF